MALRHGWKVAVVLLFAWLLSHKSEGQTPGRTVSETGTNTIGGFKNFVGTIRVPAPTVGGDAINKTYADSLVPTSLIFVNTNLNAGVVVTNGSKVYVGTNQVASSSLVFINTNLNAGVVVTNGVNVYVGTNQTAAGLSYVFSTTNTAPNVFTNAGGGVMVGTNDMAFVGFAAVSGRTVTNWIINDVVTNTAAGTIFAGTNGVTITKYHGTNDATGGGSSIIGHTWNVVSDAGEEFPAFGTGNSTNNVMAVLPWSITSSTADQFFTGYSTTLGTRQDMYGYRSLHFPSGMTNWTSSTGLVVSAICSVTTETQTWRYAFSGAVFTTNLTFASANVETFFVLTTNQLGAFPLINSANAFPTNEPTARITYFGLNGTTNGSGKVWVYGP